MIEQKYNQIWHRIKDNIKYSCKSQLYNPFGTKGYKLYDLDSRTCFVSRDVVFKESIFPFKHWSSKSNLVPFSFSHSMFSMQTIIPESSSPSISTKFTPNFTTDIATSPDEFLDTVHDNSDLDHSTPTLVDLVHPIEQPPALPPIP